jgi:2-polyprenyl-3-methyl-5-hydroxy-6-metoxy-1,4-benzoquinol methylase
MRTRERHEERLDDPEASGEELARSLAQVSQANRWLGGDRGLRAALAPLVASRPELTLLDVGTGDGSTLSRLIRWAADRGCRIEAVALDAHAGVCQVAAHRLRAESGTVRVVRGNGLTLPFGDARFDVVLSTLTLHHFDGDMARSALAEMGRVTRTRVVVSDLLRSTANFVGARLLAATVWRFNHFTRNDAPISVRRGFQPNELLDLARECGLRDASVLRTRPFRLTLTAKPWG